MLTCSDLQQLSRSHEIDFGSHPSISDVAGGDVSETYIVEGNGARYFIKKTKIKSLPRHATRPESALEYLDFQEDTVRRLGRTLPAVAAIPTKSDGSFYTRSRHHVLLLYPAVAGAPRSVGDVTHEMTAGIAKALLHLHAARPGSDASIAHERLEQYRNIGFSVLNSPLWKILSRIPLPKKIFPELSCALARIAGQNLALAQAVKDISAVAICHNDLKPKNVLWQESGDFWIIDWDAVGLFDVAADHLDTALAWSTDFSDGQLKFSPQKLQAFLSVYPFPETRRLAHSIQLVTVKWCYWLIFSLQRLFLFQGDRKKNIWNVNYAVGFILFLAPENMQQVLFPHPSAKPQENMA